MTSHACDSLLYLGKQHFIASYFCYFYTILLSLALKINFRNIFLLVTFNNIHIEDLEWGKKLININFINNVLSLRLVEIVKFNK